MLYVGGKGTGCACYIIFLLFSINLLKIQVLPYIYIYGIIIIMPLRD